MCLWYLILLILGKYLPTLLQANMLKKIKITWNRMLAWQYGPENETGPTRNWDPDGTMSVDASTLQAAAHAAWNACIAP